MQERLRSIANALATGVAAGDFDRVVSRCAQGRATASELATAIRDHGLTFVPPPDSAYDKLDAVRVPSTQVPTWSLRVPLWTKEEGRSDLEFQVTVSLVGDDAIVALDDIRVP